MQKRTFKISGQRRFYMSKYKAIKTQHPDRTWFDSKKEAKRYAELLILQRAGEISNLELQPRYNMILNGVKICSYSADFRYQDGLELVVEDVKGYKTPVYNLKKKMMKAFHSIEIFET